LEGLPATVSAAPAAAITAVTVPASATAATATAGSSSATTTAVAATAAATAGSPSATTATAFSRRPGFIDNNVAAHEIVAVQSLDGALGFFVAIDLDKSEPARLP
jgi:hypothetical protein